MCISVCECVLVYQKYSLYIGNISLQHYVEPYHIGRYFLSYIEGERRPFAMCAKVYRHGMCIVRFFSRCYQILHTYVRRTYANFPSSDGWMHSRLLAKIQKFITHDTLALHIYTQTHTYTTHPIKRMK